MDHLTYLFSPVRVPTPLLTPVITKEKDILYNLMIKEMNSRASHFPRVSINITLIYGRVDGRFHSIHELIWPPTFSFTQLLVAYPWNTLGRMRN